MIAIIIVTICLSLSAPCLAKEQKKVNPQAIPFEVNGCFNLVNQGDFQAAVEMCKQATTKYPKNKYAWHSLGKAYSGMREYKLAAVAFKKELAFVPKEEALQVYSDLCGVYQRSDDINNVIVYTNKILASNVSKEDKWSYAHSHLYYLAANYLNQEKYRASLKYWDIAIGLMNKSNIHSNKSFFLHASQTAKRFGDYPRALAYLLELTGTIRQDDLSYASLSFQIGDIYRLMRNYDKAEENLSDAIDIIQGRRKKELNVTGDMKRFLDEQEATTYLFWGWLCHDKRENDKAKDYMKRAYDLIAKYKDLDPMGHRQEEYVLKEVNFLEKGDESQRKQ